MPSYMIPAYSKIFTYKAFDSVSLDRRSNFLGNGYADSGSSELIGRKNGDKMPVLYSSTGFGQGDELTPF